MYICISSAYTRSGRIAKYQNTVGVKKKNVDASVPSRSDAVAQFMPAVLYARVHN